MVSCLAYVSEYETVGSQSNAWRWVFLSCCHCCSEQCVLVSLSGSISGATYVRNSVVNVGQPKIITADHQAASLSVPLSDLPRVSVTCQQYMLLRYRESSVTMGLVDIFLFHVISWLCICYSMLLSFARPGFVCLTCICWGDQVGGALWVCPSRNLPKTDWQHWITSFGLHWGKMCETLHIVCIVWAAAAASLNSISSPELTWVLARSGALGSPPAVKLLRGR